MAKAAILYLNVQIVGDALDSLNIVPNFVSNPNSPATHITVALINGDNTITPPTNAMYALLIPNTLSTFTKKLKSIAADSGYPISITQPTLIALAVSPGAFIVNANGIENLEVYFF